MPKFSAKVPDDLNDIVGRVKLEQTEKKSLAVEYVINLARLMGKMNPGIALKKNYSVREFGNVGDKTCNLDLDQATYKAFMDFRTQHSPVLSTGSEFFITALKLGASLYSDGYRLSDSRNFLKAELLEPCPADLSAPLSTGLAASP